MIIFLTNWFRPLHDECKDYHTLCCNDKFSTLIMKTMMNGSRKSSSVSGPTTKALSPPPLSLKELVLVRKKPKTDFD